MNVPVASPLIRIRNLSKAYRRGEQDIPVLLGIHLDVMAGDFVALMGPSGSGKSTLLNLIAGIDKPSGGTIEIGGVDIATLGEGALADWRAQHVGFIFQFYNLMPVLTAFENVLVPMELVGRRDARERATALLAEVGLAERAHHYPTQLSGGEQQRVAIARALANQPPVILADEPTAPLDSERALSVVRILNQMAQQFNTAIIVVTHDEKIIPTFKRIYHIRDGKTFEEKGQALN